MVHAAGKSSDAQLSVSRGLGVRDRLESALDRPIKTSNVSSQAPKAKSSLGLL